MKTKIISFGGGVNSVAMTILLYRRGEIYPCLFADTGCEHPETYCYMDYFEKEFLSRYSQKIIKLASSPYHHPYARVPLEQYLLQKKRVPAVASGKRACTAGWKRQPIQNYCKRHVIDIQLIAFAYDERHRAVDFVGKEYPLINEKVTRQKCIDIIKSEKLCIPPKSGCFFCSFKRISAWEQLYRKHPDLFARAMRIEENANRTIRIDKIPLSKLKERFENKGLELFVDYDYDELTPCVCLG